MTSVLIADELSPRAVEIFQSRGIATDIKTGLKPADLKAIIGRYDGLALILAGIAVIVVAAVRFIRTGKRLDDQEQHSAGSVRVELVLSATLAVLVAAFSTFLALG